jgi:hypothetical protein
MKRTGHGDLAASLVLIAPLLLVYELGVLISGRVNGADLITRAVYAAAGSRTVYIAIYAIATAVFLWWIRRSRRGNALRVEVAGPMILEAAIYALTLGAVVTLIVDRWLGLGLSLPSVIAALGAGVHEELVFRLAAIAGLLALLSSIASPRVAITLAIIISSIGFAAAHHLGPYGEPWSRHAFAFRCVAGCVFAAVYWFRSLAHAVYAHVMYDLLVAATS